MGEEYCYALYNLYIVYGQLKHTWPMSLCLFENSKHIQRKDNYLNNIQNLVHLTFSSDRCILDMLTRLASSPKRSRGRDTPHLRVAEHRIVL